MKDSIHSYVERLRENARHITRDTEIIVAYRPCEDQDPNRSMEKIIHDFLGPETLEFIKWVHPSAYPRGTKVIPGNGFAYYLENKWSRIQESASGGELLNGNRSDDWIKFWANLQSIDQSFHQPILFESDMVGRRECSETYVLFDRKNEFLLNVSGDYWP